MYSVWKNLSNLTFRKESLFLPRKIFLPLNLPLTPTKSGYLAIVGIEDFRLKESNAKLTCPKGQVERLVRHSLFDGNKR
jgi:hypothetical protein